MSSQTCSSIEQIDCATVLVGSFSQMKSKIGGIEYFDEDGDSNNSYDEDGEEHGVNCERWSLNEWL